MTTCSHTAADVLQGESRDGEAPFRVCTACGYAEEGWGYGYSRLALCFEENVVARDVALAHVRGRVIPNAEHTRREG